MASPGSPPAGHDHDQAGAGTDALADGAGPCGRCGARGWKLLSLRRSEEAAGTAGEGALLRRAKSECLACGGTGRTS
jgi:hypothetical protein